MHKIPSSANSQGGPGPGVKALADFSAKNAIFFLVVNLKKMPVIGHYSLRQVVGGGGSQSINNEIVYF